MTYMIFYYIIMFYYILFYYINITYFYFTDIKIISQAKFFKSLWFSVGSSQAIKNVENQLIEMETITLAFNQLGQEGRWQQNNAAAAEVCMFAGCRGSPENAV